MSLTNFTALIIALLFLSCSTEENSAMVKKEQKVEEQTVKKENQKIKAQKPKFPRLNSENCVDFLLKYGVENPETKIRIRTTYGDIEVELFEDTPIHRANFIYLIKRNYYNPTEILRVIKNFMIQGGNSDEELPQQKRFVIGEYTLPSEFRAHHIHLKGALAMSRSYENNPEKRSSAYDFYIIHGRKMTASDIYEARKKRSYTETQIKQYQDAGGAIHLDEEHTVFGRVTRGMGVIDNIADVPVDKGDWPKIYIEVSMEVIN